MILGCFIFIDNDMIWNFKAKLIQYKCISSISCKC